MRGGCGGKLGFGESGGMMGCGGSKDVDESMLVKLCRERKEMIKAAGAHRYVLAAAHALLEVVAGFDEQRKGIFEKFRPVIEAAVASGEAWTMPFAFCTREMRWCGFVEPEDGESTKFLQEFARKFNMVIISPTLERDVKYGETI